MNEPMVKIAGLYEKTSQKGNRYFLGRLGNAKLLMFQNQDKQQESDPDSLLYVQEREEQKPAGGDHGGDWPRRRPTA